ncbi:MAG TPA: tripartite tricarboxylate transporter substrate binding protein [Burkholderiales bacterium]|nr:tripartite tricarboxylate transporter substrate binding protein [Burkholderiales bacterium]
MKKTVAVLLALACAPALAAETYPSKPIRLIIPFPPGGATDALGRNVVQRLTETLKQPIIADNRAGASGILGLDLASKAPPDGYALVIGQAGNLAINLALMGKLPYDPVNAFTPITLLATTPNVLVVHPSMPVKSVRDLVALARSKPGQINYASSGIGSPGHITAARFAIAAKISMVHIPFKGAGPALIDVLAGNSHLYFTSPISAQPFVNSGRLRYVAVASAKRSPQMPNVPTMAESGFPEVESTSWWGLMGPANLPKDIVERLHAETVKLLNSAEVKKRLAAEGADAAPTTPAEFSALIKSEIVKWANLVKVTGVKLE